MVFDFLFNIRQNASSYVHLNEKNIKLQKEFFYELFRNNKENNIKDESVELLLDVNEMTKILFENGIQIQENTFINQDNNNKILNAFIKNLINEEDKKEKNCNLTDNTPKQFNCHDEPVKLIKENNSNSHEDIQQSIINIINGKEDKTIHKKYLL